MILQLALETINSKLKIRPILSEGLEGPARKLMNFIVFETNLDERKFVHADGVWIEVSANYVDEINASIVKIRDSTEALALPKMLNGEREDHYNTRAARDKGWLSLDKKNFPFGGHQKLEPCDLVTKAGQLICVKKMTASSGMSHLFAQAAGSADAFDRHAPFKNFLNGQIESWTPGLTVPESSVPEMVMAIATGRQESIRECLFFPSKVSMVRASQRIWQSGFVPVIAKIHWDE
jgi:uncharacterized protein (TIGR04141 family)